jgi:hypothetical protein
MTSFAYSEQSPRSYTHGLFRYPAKFHPGIASELISRYAGPGDVVFDPFCGSGTVLVEAVVRDLLAIGSDADPLATFIADAKLTRVDPLALERYFASLTTKLESATAHRDYAKLASRDIGDRRFQSELKDLGLTIPNIPRLLHWFRKYVVIDLALTKRAIARSRVAPDLKKIALLCFASIIRGASNADPVPVSGLEYTSHMRRLDEAGRVVAPPDLLYRKFDSALSAYRNLYNATRNGSSHRCSLSDARYLNVNSFPQKPDVIITSPPYVGAVDYYRRHQLETYWLDLVATQRERERLIANYIGRPKVYRSNQTVDSTPSATARHFAITHLRDSKMATQSLLDYVVSMRQVFHRLHDVSAAHSRAVFVVGRGRLRGIPLPIELLYREIAAPYFKLTVVESFSSRNRYMSYARHNGADITQELVLCFERV